MIQAEKRARKERKGVFNLAVSLLDDIDRLTQAQSGAYGTLSYSYKERIRGVTH